MSSFGCLLLSSVPTSTNLLTLRDKRELSNPTSVRFSVKIRIRRPRLSRWLSRQIKSPMFQSCTIEWILIHKGPKHLGLTQCHVSLPLTLCRLIIVWPYRTTISPSTRNSCKTSAAYLSKQFIRSAVVLCQVQYLS